MVYKKQYFFEHEPTIKTKTETKKLNWYYAPLFVAFWLALYLGIVIRETGRLPMPLTVKDEERHPDSFIAERASSIQLELAKIGPKVVGSEANEILAVEFLISEIKKIQSIASDYFDIEIDVQVASGNYYHWEMINMYQSVQNVIARLSPKQGASDKYLLINSHFDSVPDSPGAGDDGSMVSVMLEVLRVLAKSNGPLKHPIVFLFNGAEENPLQASHAFVTQHKWSKNCKALINLDSAGGGGPEILFQSGPKHPWLMQYYARVPHPFASSFAEDVFQAGLIPSDTDFRIFRDYGSIPGLDLAYTVNGYVYHTKYDRYATFPTASLQNTGDNVLSLAKSIGNAPEMYDTSKYEEGHIVFYDFLRLFLISYTENTGIIINVTVCSAGLAAIGISIYVMSTLSELSWKDIFKRCATALAIQFISLLLGTCLVLLVASFMDAIGFSLSWFSENWMIAGLYFSPMFFGMTILQATYVARTKSDQFCLGFQVQLFMHSQCFYLILITIVLTGCGFRSAYLPMIPVFFQTVAVLLNLLTKFHNKANCFAIFPIILQIPPFLYFTSCAQIFYFTLIPMTGRMGINTNVELIIGLIASGTSILFAGFIMPIFVLFRKTLTILLVFLGITLLFIVIAVTPAGFPYKAETAPQRYSVVIARRIIHNDDNSIRRDDSGIMFYPKDRRYKSIDKHTSLVASKDKLDKYCEEKEFCGMPLYNHRWQNGQKNIFWSPIDEEPNVPGLYPTLVKKSDSQTNNRKRFEFSLSGPDHMTLHIRPTNGSKLINWSFNDNLIRYKSDPPFFIYFSYGKDRSPLEFYIDVEKNGTSSVLPSMEIGVSGFWMHHETNYTLKCDEFLKSFPDYAYVDDFIGTYESWIF